MKRKDPIYSGGAGKIGESSVEQIQVNNINISGVLL